MAARPCSFRLRTALSIALAVAAGAAIPARAQIAWTTYTTGSGLGSSNVYGVYASGSTIYAAAAAAARRVPWPATKTTGARAASVAAAGQAS